MSYVRVGLILLTGALVYFSVQMIVGNWEEIEKRFNGYPAEAASGSPAELVAGSGDNLMAGNPKMGPPEAQDPGSTGTPAALGKKGAQNGTGGELAAASKTGFQKTLEEGLDQLLSAILAALASAIIGLFTKKEAGADALAESNNKTGGSGTLSESDFVERVASRHDKLKGKHKELREAYKRMARKLYKTRALATRRVRSALVLSTAVLFAVACMVASGIEVFLNVAGKTPDQGIAVVPEALDFLTVQSGITALFALLICVFTYRRYVYTRGKASLMSALYIGAVGIALPSLFGYLVQSPETWAATIANTSTVDVAGFEQVPVAVYQAITHLVGYPLVGLLGCGIAATMGGARK